MKRQANLFSTLSDCSNIGGEASLDKVGHYRAGDGPCGHHADLISELGRAKGPPIPHRGVWLNYPLSRELLRCVEDTREITCEDQDTQGPSKAVKRLAGRTRCWQHFTARLVYVMASRRGDIICCQLIAKAIQVQVSSQHLNRQ